MPGTRVREQRSHAGCAFPTTGRAAKSPRMSTLVLGAGGLLGRALVLSAPAGAEVIPLDRHACDVTDPAAVGDALEQHRPAWVINAAAYTAVDRAEAERELARAVNAHAGRVIGAAARRVDARVLQVSTDHVFSGEWLENDRGWREDDAVGPPNWYGETKRIGEEGVMRSGVRWAVVRTQWLHGPHGRSFPRTMWERALAGTPTRVVNDQWGAPTSAAALARAIWQIVGRDLEGLYHAACAGRATWYDVARRVFARAGRPELLTPCATADFPTPARRPQWAVLDTSKLAQAGITLPPWEEELDRFLDQLERETSAPSAFRRPPSAS